MALAYDSVNAISKNFVIPRLVDNVFNGNPTFKELEARKEFEEGGPKIVQPVIYATGTTESYSGYDVLDTTAVEEFTAAEFDRRFYHRPVVISREEELKNKGSNTQVLSLIQAKFKNAEFSVRDTLGSDLYVDGGGTALDGFADVVSATSTYGGIAVADMSTWAASVTNLAAATLALSDVSSKIDDLTLGDDRPTMILCRFAQYRRIRDLAQAQQRFNVSKDEAAVYLGFRGVCFEGIPVVPDPKVPSGEMYFLNFNWLHYRPNREDHMRFEPFVKPTNQNVHVAHLYETANITTSQRRQQGKITSIG